MHPRTNKILKDLKGKVLDIGCGNGELIVEYAKQNGDITGIDINSVKINNSKQLAKDNGFDLDNNLFVADLFDLPFEYESFDTIVMQQVLEHISNPEQTINHVLQFLKHKGTLIITVPNGFSHIDPDHKNFFFTKDQLELLTGTWVFVVVPSYFIKHHSLIDIDKFLSVFNQKYLIEQLDYKTSIQPSLDFYIKLKKVNDK